MTLSFPGGKYSWQPLEARQRLSQPRAQAPSPEPSLLLCPSCLRSSLRQPIPEAELCFLEAPVQADFGAAEGLIPTPTPTPPGLGCGGLGEATCMDGQKRI